MPFHSTVLASQPPTTGPRAVGLLGRLPPLPGQLDAALLAATMKSVAVTGKQGSGGDELPGVLLAGEP